MRTKRNGNIHNKRKKTKRIHYGGDMNFEQVMANHNRKMIRRKTESLLPLRSFSQKDIEPIIHDEKVGSLPLSREVVSSIPEEDTSTTKDALYKRPIDFEDFRKESEREEKIINDIKTLVASSRELLQNPGTCVDCVSDLYKELSREISFTENVNNQLHSARYNIDTKSGTKSYSVVGKLFLDKRSYQLCVLILGNCDEYKFTSDDIDLFIALLKKNYKDENFIKFYEDLKKTHCQSFVQQVNKKLVNDIKNLPKDLIKKLNNDILTALSNKPQKAVWSFFNSTMPGGKKYQKSKNNKSKRMKRRTQRKRK